MRKLLWRKGGNKEQWQTRDAGILKVSWGKALLPRVNCGLLSEMAMTRYFIALRKITVDKFRIHRLLSGAPGDFCLSHFWLPCLSKFWAGAGPVGRSRRCSQKYTEQWSKYACACVHWRGRDACVAFEVLCWPVNRCWLCFSSNSFFCFQQSYAPAPHPMAPPSPSTNSSSNHSSNHSSGEQLSKTNLYIRGLPPGTTDQDLIKLCQP